MSSSLMSNYGRIDITFERGEGPYLYTAEGERYLDFVSGIGVTSLGHSHPALVAAVNEQADKLWHVSNLYNITPQEELADRLCATSFADRALFCNSGAEAVEACLKLARIYHDTTGNPGRWKVVTFRNAFHGRTLATIAAAGQPKHLKGFEPEVRGFEHVDFGDLDGARAAIDVETAAILVEPVQGEGGIHIASNEFMQGLRALCDEHGILLILDEVQCGMGRTGTMWGYEESGITPDIMAVAKALGGGFPIGACLATEQVAAAFSPGTHGSTFGGNPLATAVANAVMEEMQAPGFLEHVEKMGALLMQRIEGLLGNKRVFESVRGKGLMIGVQCVPPALEVMAELRKQGLLTVIAEGNALRLLPPLNIGEAEIDEACAAFERAIEGLET